MRNLSNNAKSVIGVILTAVLACASIPVTAQQSNNPPLWTLFRITDDPVSVEKIMTALQRGADPNVTDNNGNSAVHYAAGYNVKVLQAVIRHGGSCTKRNAHGSTPLHIAAAHDGAGVPGAAAVRVLRDCGASPNPKDARGNTPLHALYEGPRIGLGSTLPNVNKIVGGKRTDIVQALLAMNADPNIRNKAGETPLTLLLQETGLGNYHLSQLRMMLNAGADPNTRDKAGNPAIIQAIRYQSYVDRGVSTISALLKAGADPDMRNRRGDTPLVYAAKFKSDIGGEVRLLLANGANPCLENKAGKLPHELSPEGSDRRRLLKDAGGSRLGVQFTFETSGVRDTEGMCELDAKGGVQAGKSPKVTEAGLKLTRDQRRKIQKKLAAEGFNPGKPDGVFGRRTREAIHGWQSKRNARATGYLTAEQAGYLTGQAVAGAAESLSPKCPVEDDYCWIEVSNKPGCYLWTWHGEDAVKLKWSGKCNGGFASGKGRVTTSEGRKFDGSFVDGKRNGHWVLHYPGLIDAEGPYVDGKQHGRWIERWGDESVYPENIWEGPYVDGERNGHWVVRHALLGILDEGPYVDGEKNGHWVRRLNDGVIWEGPYVDGEKNGRWVGLRPDRTTFDACYRADEEIDCN